MISDAKAGMGRVLLNRHLCQRERRRGRPRQTPR